MMNLVEKGIVLVLIFITRIISIANLHGNEKLKLSVVPPALKERAINEGKKQSAPMANTDQNSFGLPPYETSIDYQPLVR